MWEKFIVINAMKNQIALLADGDMLSHMAEELPKDSHAIKILDDQIDSLEKEIRHYDDLQEKLYVDHKEKIIEKDDYEELKSRFASKKRQAEESKLLVEKKKRKTLEEPILPLQWLEEIQSIGHVDTITRKLVAMLVEKVIVYDKEHVEVVFRYGDQINYILGKRATAINVEVPEKEAVAI